MDPGHARDESAVPFVRLDDDRSGLRDADVRSGHPHLRGEEQGTEFRADRGQDARRFRSDRFSIFLRQHLRNPIGRHVDRREDEMGRLLPRHLTKELAQVRLDGADPLRGETLVHLDLLRGQGLRFHEEVRALGPAHVEQIPDRLLTRRREEHASAVRSDGVGKGLRDRGVLGRGLLDGPHPIPEHREVEARLLDRRGPIRSTSLHRLPELADPLRFLDGPPNLRREPLASFGHWPTSLRTSRGARRGGNGDRGPRTGGGVRCPPSGSAPR